MQPQEFLHSPIGYVLLLQLVVASGILHQCWSSLASFGVRAAAFLQR